MNPETTNVSGGKPAKAAKIYSWVFVWALVCACVVGFVALYTAPPLWQQGVAEVQQAPYMVAGQDLVNINTAPVEELMVLPGIGQGKAEEIVLYRQQNGAFKTKEELMQVKGIGEKTYQNLQAYICL